MLKITGAWELSRFLLCRGRRHFLTRNAPAHLRAIKINKSSIFHEDAGAERRRAVAGRKRKYKTARALERAVDSYFATISYEVPAVVSTPTGEVGEDGRVTWKAVMLREKTDTSGAGEPIVTTKWLRPPSMAGLMLHLGISRETWSSYGGLEDYREVVERARARMEDYWTTRLEGKGAQGAKFALSSCYGWREGGGDSAEGETVRIIDDL